MKKLLALVLCLCMALSLVACTTTTEPAESPSSSSSVGGADEPDSTTTEPMVYRDLYSSEVTTLNYLIASQQWDQQVAANVIDSLVENDPYGNIIPGLALTWENSEDGLTWTFHLREGVKWYDYQGNEIAEVTANDFVDALEYVMTAENESLTYSQVACIKNAEAFYNKEITDFAEVGVKALDDYTLEYTLEQPTPYFLSGLTYTPWFPAYGPLLDELGKDFGTSNDKLYYCGAYILAEYEPQGHHLYVKNENNWDADQIYIDRIERTYNAEAATLGPQMILRDEIDTSDISMDIVDDWKANNAEYLSRSRTDSMWSYFYCFNFDPTYDEQYAPEDWATAVNNENFRHSIMSAMDRVYAIRALEPDDPESLLQNTITPADFCSVDGTDFSQLTAFQDNAQYFYDETKALEYKEAAMAELEGQVTFPIQVVISYKSGDTDWENECILIKQQLEGVLGTDYIVCELWAGPSENFLAETRRNGKYSIMKCNWGADYIDPQTWTDPWDGSDNLDPDTGICIGNSYNRMDAIVYNPELQAAYPETYALMQQYVDAVAAAKGEVMDMTARYDAFAEAEDLLIEHAFVIPFMIAPSSYQATKLNIYEGQYSPSGISTLRFKGQKVYDHFITMEEFEANREAWEEARSGGAEAAEPAESEAPAESAAAESTAPEATETPAESEAPAESETPAESPAESEEAAA